MTSRVAAIYRYPVKSMLGEMPDRVKVGTYGIAGDRAYAVKDLATGLVGSAKVPRRWATLLTFSARYAGDPDHWWRVDLTAADGSVAHGDDPDVDQWLSARLGREVTLVRSAPKGARYELEWPDVVEMAPDDVIECTRTGTSPEGRPVSTLPVSPRVPESFNDVAPVSLLTTTSLHTASAWQPAGDWQVARFRPNFVLDVRGVPFPENEWNGRRLRLGDVVLEVMAPTARCVMTTLPQDSLPEDLSILRTLARFNRISVEPHGRFACFGAYASVLTPSEVAVGDKVVLLDT